MKVFFKRLIVFLSILIVVLGLIDWGFTKSQYYRYGWGNQLYLAKLQDIEKQKDINTFFLGSSHFYRQIDPVLFDSIVNANSISTNSYNVGIPGLANPENYYLLENLLENKNSTIKNIVIVLSQLQSIEPENYFKPRSTYFLDLQNLAFANQVAWNEKSPVFTKINRIFSFNLNYAFNMIGLSDLKSHLGNPESIDPKSAAANKKGFLPLDDDISTENTTRYNEFRKDTAQLEKREKNATNDFSENPSGKRFNKAHFQRIVQLIEKCKKKGVRLSFVVPPRMLDYSDIVALEQKLPESCIIDLANPMKFPEFYQIENSFDIGHLNKKGAAIFTRKLAEKFMENYKIINN